MPCFISREEDGEKLNYLFTTKLNVNNLHNFLRNLSYVFNSWVHCTPQLAKGRIR